jgi:hypothetical protein
MYSKSGNKAHGPDIKQRPFMNYYDPYHNKSVKPDVKHIPSNIPEYKKPNKEHNSKGKTTP